MLSINVVSLFLILISCKEQQFGPEELSAYTEIRSDSIKIDFSQEIGEYAPFTDYLNSSLRRAPKYEFPGIIEGDFGRPKIIRCWLLLDLMWDYRTDTYNYNFKIGDYKFYGDTLKFHYNWDKFDVSPYYYEDHLKSFANKSDQVLLNIFFYHREVIEGLITLEQWGEIVKKGIVHYLELCPNLTYIEVLNETSIEQFGGLTAEQYYMFYKKSYEIVNEINREKNLSNPLQVGGPTSSGNGLNTTRIKTENEHFGVADKLQQLYLFLKKYKEDSDPDKKLDFISFHEYHLENDPKTIQDYQEIVQGILEQLDLNTQIPIFIDECGIMPYYKITNLIQATGIQTLHQYTRKSDLVKLFPWVTYHTEQQQKFVLYDIDYNKTAFGMVGALANLHEHEEVYSKSYNIDQNGLGIHVAATKSIDDNRYYLHFWNYSPDKQRAIVEIKGMNNSILGEYDVMGFYVDTTVYTVDRPYLQHFEKSDKLSSQLVNNEHLTFELEPYTTLFLSIGE